ncbi:MAG: hypothetical protein OXG35_28670 [Acidobacteria bacterium]|nr:hypothetical protein [Acidobacteriota bacterium]
MAPNAPFKGRACATAAIVILLGAVGFMWYESSVEDAPESPKRTAVSTTAAAHEHQIPPGQQAEVLLRERLLRQEEQLRHEEQPLPSGQQAEVLLRERLLRQDDQLRHEEQPLPPAQQVEVLLRERLLRQEEQLRHEEQLHQEERHARLLMETDQRAKAEADHARRVREELDAQRDRRLDYLDRVDRELSGKSTDNESAIAELLERVRVLEEWREQALCHAAIVALQSPRPEDSPVAVIPSECAESFPLLSPPPADTDDASETATGHGGTGNHTPPTAGGDPSSRAAPNHPACGDPAL